MAGFVAAFDNVSSVAGFVAARLYLVKTGELLKCYLCISELRKV